MIYTSGQYALVIVTFDITILITVLLFRKPKRKSAISTQDRKLSKPVGYYLVMSAITVLVLWHYASYASLANYLEGLLIDAFLFYFGLKVVVNE